MKHEGHPNAPSWFVVDEMNQFDGTIEELMALPEPIEPVESQGK